MFIRSSSQLESPTYGAGSSKPKPQALPLPLSHGHRLDPQASNLRTRTSTRSSTFSQQVELGVHLNPEPLQEVPKSTQFSPSGSRLYFSKTSRTFVANSEWSTDIVTFCIHARSDTGLGQARITHVQARKSHKPPFLHEYILVFFTASNNQRFVVRIDRLGKIKLTSAGGVFSWFTGRRGTDNTAIQQVEMHHIKDDRCGIDASEAPWSERDVKKFQSCPVHTHGNNASSERRRTTIGSDSLRNAKISFGDHKLLFHDSFVIIATSVLLSDMGSTSDQLINASHLVEPIWAGLIR
ncbi:hypothetical protein RHS03_09708, partial [Rhizoctonia solani]